MSQNRIARVLAGAFAVFALALTLWPAAAIAAVTARYHIPGAVKLASGVGGPSDFDVSGDYVVWTVGPVGGRHLRLYNITTGVVATISPGPADQYSPRISGNLVVWVDTRNGNPDIHAYDIVGKTTAAICTNPAVQKEPAVSDGTVVWTDLRSDAGDIYSRERIEWPSLGFSAESQVTSQGVQGGPDVFGGKIAWTVAGSPSYGVILDQSTGVRSVLSGGWYNVRSPCIGDEDVVLWESGIASDWQVVYSRDGAYKFDVGGLVGAYAQAGSHDIAGKLLVYSTTRVFDYSVGGESACYLRNLNDLSVETTLTRGGSSSARIDGRRVVWWESTSQGGDVYLYDIPGVPTRRFEPIPYTWWMRNGSDTDAGDDILVMADVETIMGGGSTARGLMSSLIALYLEKNGAFQHGNCFGMSATSLVNYCEAGDLRRYQGVLGAADGAGLWSLRPRSRAHAAPTADDPNAYPIFDGTTDDAVREHVEAFQYAQIFRNELREAAGTSATLAEIERRLDAGLVPPLVNITGSQGSHTVVPYRYERSVPGAPGATDVYIYDSNHPGAGDRVIRFVDAFQETEMTWFYRLFDGIEWAWDGTGSTMSWTDPDTILAFAAKLDAQPGAAARLNLAAPSAPTASFSVRVANAYSLVEDDQGRRTGYPAPGAALLNEIPGAQPVYPDALGGDPVIAAFSFQQAAPVQVALTPRETGPVAAQLADSDSSVLAMVSTPIGETDRVVVNQAVDGISVEPAAGIRTVTLWAGTWAMGSQVMFGAIDATTTAGDLVLFAEADTGRVQNRSQAPKTLTIAVLGAGWVGRRSVPVTVPAGGTIEVTVSSPSTVATSTIHVRDVSGSSIATAASSPYGEMPMAIATLPDTVGCSVPFAVNVRTASSLAPNSLRLQTSPDRVHWTDAGAFDVAVGNGVLSRLVRLKSSAWIRAVLAAGDAYNESSAGAKRVAVRAEVYTPVAPARASRSRRFAIYGYVAPRHTSGTYLVTLKFYLRNSHGVYVYHHSVNARRYYYSTTKTKYKATVSLPHKGRWRVRAYHSDAGHAPSYSGYDYITVR